MTKIKTYHFLPCKYGTELLLDIGRIETLNNYVLDNTLHQLSFYEVIFIEEGSGTFTLDENKILIVPQTIIFTSPGQVRCWEIKEKVKGYTLFFDKDFLHLFFSDELFLYRFQYFHQYSHPTAIRISEESFEKCLELVYGIEQEFGQLQNDSNHLIEIALISATCNSQSILRLYSQCSEGHLYSCRFLQIPIFTGEEIRR